MILICTVFELNGRRMQLRLKGQNAPAGQGEGTMLAIVSRPLSGSGRVAP
jgi:hypothetical protein